MILTAVIFSTQKHLKKSEKKKAAKETSTTTPGDTGAIKVPVFVKPKVVKDENVYHLNKLARLTRNYTREEAFVTVKEIVHMYPETVLEALYGEYMTMSDDLDKVKDILKGESDER